MNSLIKNFLLLALTAGLVWGCGHQNKPEAKSEDVLATCAVRLQMIDGAKQLWTEKGQKTTNDTPTPDELSVFLRGMPACPSGGTYTMTRSGELSTCSIAEHTAYYHKSASAK